MAVVRSEAPAAFISMKHIWLNTSRGLAFQNAITQPSFGSNLFLVYEMVGGKFARLAGLFGCVVDK